MTPKHHTHVDMTVTRPLQEISIDTVGPWSADRRGYRYAVTIQDNFTRYVFCYKTFTKEAGEVWRGFQDNFVSAFGLPESLRSDQGKEYCNQLWRAGSKLLGINKIESMAYNPNSQAGVERFHKTFEEIIRTYLDIDNTAEWSDLIPMASFAFNTKISATTGVSPFEGFYGRKPILPLHLVCPPPDQEQFNSPVDMIRETKQRFKMLYAYMLEKQRASIQRSARTYQDEGKDSWFGIIQPDCQTQLSQ